MKYLVFLDSKSMAGETYAAGNNDGFANSQPALRCGKIDTSDIHYLYCEREAISGTPSLQRLHIPHHAVAYIFEYGAADEFPFGFVPASTL